MHMNRLVWSGGGEIIEEHYELQLLVRGTLGAKLELASRRAVRLPISLRIEMNERNVSVRARLASASLCLLSVSVFIQPSFES